MATVAAFNGLMAEFLKQMRRTGEKLKMSDPGAMKVAQMALQQCQDSTDSHKQRYVMTKFAKYTVPHRVLLQARNPDGTFNESMFKEFLETAKDSPLMQAINVHKFWDKLPENSKQGIWKFMNQLLTMAIAITAIPEVMLSQIESMAQTLVSSGDPDKMPDPADFAQMLGSMASMGSGPPSIDGAQPDMMSLLNGLMGRPR